MSQPSHRPFKPEPDPQKAKPKPASNRRLYLTILGLLIAVGLAAWGIYQLVKPSPDRKECDATIEIQKIDVKGSFKDSTGVIDFLGDIFDDDLELYVESAVYGYFDDDSPEITQGQRIGTSQYTLAGGKPGSNFPLDPVLVLTIDESEFKGYLLKVDVVIIELDKVPGILIESLEILIDTQIPFAGQILGAIWGDDLGNFLNGNDLVARETILLKHPKDWKKGQVVIHQGVESNLDTITYALDRKCHIK